MSVQSTETVYPEHEKLKAIAAQSQSCGEFIDWLSSKGITLCSRHIHTDECYGLGRSPNCGLRDGEFLLAGYNIQELLAEFFQIDRDKLEAEKRQILDEFRLGSKRHDSG